MNHLKVMHSASRILTLCVCCVTLAACHNSENTATFSGTLLDVNGKPISGHVVTLYPVEMSDYGSVFYQPIMAIATSPEFLTARTKRNGTFAFTQDINPGMIRLGLLPPKFLDNIRKPDPKEVDLRPEYHLVSVKIGVMTFYADDIHGAGSTTFSWQTDRRIQNAVVIARPEMWIQGKIVLADKKPLANATVMFKVQSRMKHASSSSRYGDSLQVTDAKGNFTYSLFYHSQPRFYKVSVEYQRLSAASKEFLIKGGIRYKRLVLTLNGDSSAIPNDPKPPEPPPMPGAIPPPKKLTPEQWIVNPANGHAYTKILCENLEAAKDQAASERAYLVAINDEDEQNWVSGVFGNELYWIGLYKTENAERWQWDSGEPLTYTNWGPKNRFPSHILSDGEKHASVMTFIDGEWHAVASDDLFWNVTKMALLEKDDWRTGTTAEDR
ncbi:hypothetical protein F4009_23035 [Candidatus Poribacteria bacterium]|nr:hypothetical protein [Candidatus Poribacteria bacterium]MYK96833.1 hypothetical protein [Candidatus Poribacteria bacterium]